MARRRQGCEFVGHYCRRCGALFDEVSVGAVCLGGLVWRLRSKNPSEGFRLTEGELDRWRREYP